MTISFTSETPISPTNGCFIKYSFPLEFDLSIFDTENVEATGMFVETEGKAQSIIYKHNFEDEAEERKWVAIEGCAFDPKNKTNEALKNFEQNVFNVTFYNLVNPWEIIDTGELKIEVFSVW